jgi:hypothetical protein
MQQFMRKFTQLDGERVKVLLEHCLFDTQTFYCDKLQIIDDDRIGVVIKGKEIFMDKQDVKIAEMHDGAYKISDGRLTIMVIMNKM